MPPVSPLTDSSIALPLAAALLLPLMPLGLLLFQVGMSRVRNTAHTFLTGLAAIALALLGTLAFGAWIAGIGGGGHGLWLGGRFWDLVGRHEGICRLASQTVTGLELWQLVWGAAAVALLIVAGGLERWRWPAALVTGTVGAVVFLPLLAHWIWLGGWLAQAPQLLHLPNGPVDPAGAGVVQMLGGLIALSAMIQVGPRLGKFQEDGPPAALPAHSIVLVLLSCLLLLPGWLGWNLLGAELHVTAPMPIRIALNTVAAAAAGLLAALLISAWRFGKPDASLSANGWIAGLAASGAGCALMGPVGMTITGAVAGIAVIFVVELVELGAGLDDPAGVLPSHLVAGLIGLLAAGLFGYGASKLGQLLECAVLVAFFWPLSYALVWGVGKIIPHRLEPDEERRGLDLAELGAGSYPEFVTHDDTGV